MDIAARTHRCKKSETSRRCDGLAPVVINMPDEVCNQRGLFFLVATRRPQHVDQESPRPGRNAGQRAFTGARDVKNA